MKRIFLPLLVCFSFYSCDELMPLVDAYNEGNLEPTTAEVTAGLKEALKVGIKNAVAESSKTNGFYNNALVKIPIPAEAKKLDQTLRDLGMGKLMDDFELSLNRAAEEASAKAVDVFVHSISQMTLDDAVGIWQGADDAATQYLKRTSTDKLEAEFKPIAKNAIEKVHVTQYWDDAAKVYNQIPFVQKVNPDLDDYVTHQAIDGLFKLVALEEKKIRDDPAARISDILVRVFGYTKP